MAVTSTGSLQSRAVATAIVALGMALAAAWAAGRWLDVSSWFVLTAALVFHAGMSMVLLFLASHHPFPRFGPANAVTTFRLALVSLLVACTLESATLPMAAAATVLAVVNTLLDGADGWLARRTGLASAFGARFDLETDAVFVLVMSVLVWRHDKAGGWVLAGGLYRYAFAAAAMFLPWMSRPLRPTKRARLTAACHMLGLTAALAPFVPLPTARAGAAATLALLTWSFAVDVGRLWRGDTT